MVKKVWHKKYKLAALPVCAASFQQTTELLCLPA